MSVVGLDGDANNNRSTLGEYRRGRQRSQYHNNKKDNMDDNNMNSTYHTLNHKSTSPGTATNVEGVAVGSVESDTNFDALDDIQLLQQYRKRTLSHPCHDNNLNGSISFSTTLSGSDSRFYHNDNKGNGTLVRSALVHGGKSGFQLRNHNNNTTNGSTMAATIPMTIMKQTYWNNQRLPIPCDCSSYGCC